MLTWTVHLEGGPNMVNHAAVVIGSRIFSFGGLVCGEDMQTTRLMDVHMLNTVTLRWTLIPLPNEEQAKNSPYQRYGHTAVEYEDMAYVWGGRNESLGTCKVLYRFSGSTLTWDKPPVTGPIPEARDGHSACIVNDRMYIFAGYEEFTDRFSNNLSYLDLKTFSWVPVGVLGIPPQWRDFHTMTPIGTTLYVFGGRCDKGGDRFTNNEIYCNKINVFDTATNTWMRPAKPTSSSPISRRSHSAFEYKGYIYIFGGYNSQLEVHFNDLHRLDPTALQWTKLNVPGNSPSPRRRQCACVVGSKVYFFGGTSPRISGDKKEPSSEHLDTDLIDQSDLHILDFEPSLKTLASLVIIKHNLDRQCLPHDLRWELAAMTTDNTLSRLHTVNG